MCSYGRHVYCDGGMCNDFPMNALPDDGHRLGLMVRPKDWYMYNFGSLHTLKRGANTHVAEAEVSLTSLPPTRTPCDQCPTQQTSTHTSSSRRLRLSLS
eukprot:scaffold296646_cov33-Tisochrysis_lutea.AAC.5